MKTWKDLCSEPLRHKEQRGGEIFRFINRVDFEAIQADAIAAERARLEKLGGINLAQFEHVTQEYIRQGKELEIIKKRTQWIKEHWPLQIDWGDGDDNEVVVYLIRGNVNDREWEKVGTGETFEEAIDAAMKG